MKRTFLPLLALLFSITSLPAAKPTAVQPPRLNVIFILADDLGWADTTLYGQTSLYETPHLERLAKRGMLFSRAYANSPLCSPTRASILTGQTPARHGSTAPAHHLPLVRLKPTVQTSGNPGNKALQTETVTRLDTGYPTLGKLLKAAGYATAHFGKWHLGPAPHSPLQHGFDVDIPHWHGPGPPGSFVAPWTHPNFKPNSPQEHIEDRMAAEATLWMRSLPKDQPFYMNYWQFSVHAPFNAKESLIKKYRGKIDPANKHHSPTYAAMVEALDDAVGTLMAAVDEAGIADRTVFIFTSDNGGNMYNGIRETDPDGNPFVTAPTSNRPLRGGKATLYEGGFRVPTIVSWPGLTQAGSRSDAPIQTSDFYPTLLSGLGVPLPKNHPLDGIDIAPALRGGALQRKAIFTFFPHAPPVPDWLPPSVAVHTGDWKLIRLFHEGENGAHDYRLYNLKDDLGESNNLAGTHPEKVRLLDRLIEDYLAAAGTVVPQPNEKFDPKQYKPERIGIQPGGLKMSGQPKPKSKAKKPPTKATKPVGGWRAGGTCTLTAANGLLIQHSSGRDPQLLLDGKADIAGGPFTLSMRVKTSAGTGVLAFCNPPFRQGGFTKLGSTAAGGWTELSGKLDVPQLTGLRIDPLTGPGRAEIDWIRVQNAHGKIVKEWGF